MSYPIHKGIQPLKISIGQYESLFYLGIRVNDQTFSLKGIILF